MNNIRHPGGAIALAVLTCIAMEHPVQAAKPLGDLTGPWQLFVDDHLIASKTRVTRRYHAFRKHKDNPLIVPDRPWEKDVVSVCTVLPTEDGSGYRMWYYCWTQKDGKRGSYDCYAVSKDGIRWEKPELGLAEGPDGTKRNNIIPHAGASIIHTPWTNDPQRQYHSVTSGHYFAAASPDGLHWKRLSDKPVVGGGDVGWFRYDPRRQKFVGFVKVNAEVSGLRRRAVGFTESADITSFPELRLIMAPDDFDDRWVLPGTVQRAHFYGCPFFPYESMYIGLLWIYRADDVEEGYFHGPIFNELVTSRDGFHWHRQEGERPPILDRGKPPRAWDQGMIVGLSLIRVGDELRLYYSGYDDSHDYLPFHSGIGLATLRKDGFASLDAGQGPGEVLTKRLAGTRGPLHVNYRAGGGGSVRVEVLDADGNVLPGFGRQDCDALTGDHVDKVVTWRGRQTWPEGVDVVRLRFTLQNASLYSFAAGDDVEILDEPTAPPLQALYTFEPGGTSDLEDRLWADGYQALIPMGTIRRDRDPANVGRGERSLLFGSPWHSLHRLRIEGSTQLGTHFTLALMVRTSEHRPVRLFSAYRGHHPVNTSELVFDCDPRGRAMPGLRLICKGIAVESQPVQFADEKYHHLAVTYDDGRVSFYLDGRPVGEAWLPGGAPVTLCRDLMVGEDLELGTDEQLRGYLDDILVIGRALTAADIAAIHEKGAEAFVADGTLRFGSNAAAAGE